MIEYSHSETCYFLKSLHNECRSLIALTIKMEPRTNFFFFFLTLSPPYQLGDRWVAVAPCTGDTPLTWARMGGWKDASWAGKWKCMSSVEKERKEIYHKNMKKKYHKSSYWARKLLEIKSQCREIILKQLWHQEKDRKRKRKRLWHLTRSQCTWASQTEQKGKKKALSNFDETAKENKPPGVERRGKNVKRNNTHIWVIVYIWDQVVNESLQGPGHKVVVMIIEAGIAFLLGLIQVLVVAVGAQLPRKRWCLRHAVL